MSADEPGVYDASGAGVGGDEVGGARLRRRRSPRVRCITYTLTFSNTAGQAPATVNHTDDLSRVFDDATVTTPPALASGAGLTVGAITGGAFTITGTIAAGATATVTFAVTVNTSGHW